MDNRINIEGIKVLSLNRTTQSKFKDLYELGKNGRTERVYISGPAGDTKRLLVSIVENDNDIKFGKISQDDNPNYSDILAAIDSGYDAEIYGVDGSAILIRINQKEPLKDFNSGYDATEAMNYAKGIVGEQGLKERVDYLIQHGFTEDSRIFNQVLMNIRENDEMITRPQSLYLRINPNETSLIYKILANLVVGNYPILQGPKSVGKNVAWESVAWILNCKIITLQCSERMTLADMLGYQTSDFSNKEKITEEGFRAKLNCLNKGEWSDAAIHYQLACDRSNSSDLILTPGPVTKALLRAGDGKGTILLVDEMNLADSNTLAGVFNSLTDHHTPYIQVTGLGEVPIPKNFIIGATQNANTGNYSGVNTQNTATMSRFTCIDIKESATIKDILKREADIWGVQDSILNGMNNVYLKFKEMAFDGEDSVSADSLNIRGFESAVRLCGIGLSAREAITEGVINTVTDYDEIQVLIQVLDDFVDAKGNFPQ